MVTGWLIGCVSVIPIIVAFLVFYCRMHVRELYGFVWCMLAGDEEQKRLRAIMIGRGMKPLGPTASKSLLSARWTCYGSLI
jgi:hypothetical protein